MSHKSVVNSTCAHERRRLHLVWPALLPAVTLLALVPVVSASVALADGRVAMVGNSENHAADMAAALCTSGLVIDFVGMRRFCQICRPQTSLPRCQGLPALHFNTGVGTVASLATKHHGSSIFRSCTHTTTPTGSS